ncbi:MAG TPA: hypothetical protein VFV28_03325 [Limnobacter sp.]|nr:hypothetical protein [Limnobacter sp.]
MKQQPRPLEQARPAEEGRKSDPLMPGWAMALVLALALLVLLGYASPDMRAVYVAAWAACF